ncbi:RHS repeat-associated core domain-containing protein [Candidatus Leptofilum sp.]|uniref:RHS repeat-associated core domain-containing protein n=1 Tax=Candidatus Leptofilum sp. TaxID=3241576 RepID=UPI003B5B2EA2
MRRFARLCVRAFCFLLLTLFVLQLPALITVAAQTIDPGPAPVADTTLPSMAFQPPSDADKIEDFVPPGVELVRYDVAKGEDSAYTLDSDKGNAIAFNSDHIGIIMEAGTIPNGTLLEFKESTDSTTISKEADAEVKPDPSYTIQFHVETVDQLKTDEVQQFERMSRIVVDMRHFGIDLEEVGGYFYLAYEDENNPGTWIEVPTDSYGKTGLISAEVAHFSNWQSGWRPEAWALEWRPPTVNEFTGTARYQYPFNIPAGRAGLQPTVALSYNSASLRGAVRQVAYGSVATGWSLSDISITRTGIKNGESAWTYPDTFRLTINGTGGRLVKGDTTSGVTTFYVEDMPHIQVLNYGGRKWDQEVSGNTYWIVRDGSGVTYRLGYTEDSYSLQDTELNNGGIDREITAWHVDTVTDAFGNQINYTYNRPARYDNWGFWCPWGGNCSWEVWTYNSQVAHIYYNFDERITSSPSAHNVNRKIDSGTATYATHIHVVYGSSDQRLTEIKIYHGDGSLPIRKYLINATNEVKNNPLNCDTYGGGAGQYTTSKTWTRVINSIEEQGYDVISSQWIALPATTFSYTFYHHYTHTLANNAACFQYKYMTSYENGYGGEVEFTYGTNGRQVGDYDNCRGSAQCDPAVLPSQGRNYWITQVKVYDGQNPDPVITNYNYQDICYDQTQVHQNEPICPQPDTTTTRGSMGGFGEVTVTTYDYDGTTPLLIRKTYYHQEANKYGRPEQTDIMDGNSVLLTRNEYVYTVSTYSSYNVQFTYTYEESTKHYHSGSNSTDISSKVRYAYNASYQNIYDGSPSEPVSRQLGQVTHIEEFDSASTSTPFRTTRQWYRANSKNERWVIRNTSIGVYETNSWNQIHSTWNYYDNLTDHGGELTQGALTRTRNLLPGEISCSDVPGGDGSGGGYVCDTAYLTSEQTFAYDAYGNVTSQSSYSDYGYQTQDTLNTPGSPDTDYTLRDVPPSGILQTTDIDYEADYNLYPVMVTDPANQITRFAIYGFKNSYGSIVSLSGFQSHAGLLKRVVSPNGATVDYEYDPFGRLFAVYDSSDTTGFGNTNRWDGNPLNRYRYWDTTWNDSWTTLDPFAVTIEERPDDYPGPDTNDSKHATIHYYDGLGREIQVRQRYVNVAGVGERDVVVVNEYNALGQVSCTSVPFYVSTSAGTVTDSCSSKDRTTTTYDALGRPLIITAPDGTTTTNSYSVLDTVTVDSYNILSKVETIDGNGQGIRRFSNARGELVLVRELNETNGWYADTRYSYDLLGNLVTVGTSGSQNSNPGTFLREVTMTYDNFGRKTGMEDPDMGDWSYEYDAAGNLTRQIDANGDVLCFYYDEMNRLTRQVEDSSPGSACPTTPPTSGQYHIVSYDYNTSGNGAGQIDSVSWGPDPTQNKDEFTYDSLGRVTQQDRWIDNRLYTMATTSFDTLNRPLTMVYPNGDEVTIGYDREGENTLTLTLPGDDTVLVEDITFNAFGQMVHIDRSNDIPNTDPDTTYTYGSATNNFRLEKIAHGTAGDNRPDFEFAYDNIGNITTITNTVSASYYGTDVQSFTYDSLNRLTSACTLSGSNCTTGSSNGHYNHTYAYDILGNITSFNGDTYTYGDADHIHAVTTVGSNTYAYDDNGNMTSRTEGGVTYTQNFDVQNRLTSVVASGDTTTFSYDASGFRVKTVEPDGTVIYTPFPFYEEEVQPSGQSGLESDGTLVAVPAAGQDTSTTANGNGTTSAHLSQLDETLPLLFVFFASLFLVGIYVLTQRQMLSPRQVHLAWRTLAGLFILTIVIASLGLTHSVQATNGELSDPQSPMYGAVQSPWVSADIGTVGVAGSADETSGTFTLDGAGANIAGTVDAFHFVYQSLSGDGTITANVASLTGGGSTPRAGLMMRESLADNSAHVSAVVQGNRIRVLDRATTGGSTTDVQGHSQGAPEWLRIERSGNTFTLSRSNDGSSWTVMQTRTITMGTTIYMGMAVTGNSTTTLATGTFDNVSVSGSGGSTATPTATNTPTNTPTPTATSVGPTPTPSPTPTTPPPTEVTIQRLTFMFAGQPIAVKVDGDPTSTNNGIFYIFTDHLGSTVVLTKDSDGYIRGDSLVRYLPFGGYRGGAGTQDLTDRGYTGHKENLDIGLIYMNARFYVPTLNRFASADTIVPDPANPQSFNRFSYAYNNPINYSDPSGHNPVCNSDGSICSDDPATIDPAAKQHGRSRPAPSPAFAPPQGYEWALMTPGGNGRVSWYDYPIINDPNITHPDQLPYREGIGDYNYYQVQGSVMLNGQAWNYRVDENRWTQNTGQSVCQGGFVSATQCVTPYQFSSQINGEDPYQHPTTGAVNNSSAIPMGQGNIVLVQINDGKDFAIVVETRDECPGCNPLQIDILARDPLTNFPSYNIHGGASANVYFWVAVPKLSAPPNSLAPQPY